MPISHPFVNPHADGVDATVTRPSNWNAPHVIGDALTNANAGTMPPGTPVYCSASGAMNLAKAAAAATAECIGLVPAAVLAAAIGLAQEVDSVTLTTAQWDAVAGTTGGLTPGTRYFLSAATAGLLTATAPSTAGQFVVSIGTALTSTIMRLRVQPPIGL